jgi:hypothetical protein
VVTLGSGVLAQRRPDDVGVAATASQALHEGARVTDVQRRTTPSRRWLAWAGDIEQLCRIGRAVEAAAAEHPEPGQVVVKVILVEGSDEVSGSIDGVLSELDRRNVDRITFQIDEKSSFLTANCLKITLDSEFVFAAQLEVKSEYVGWARSTFARLSGEIQRGVPRWANLHSPTGKALTFLVIQLVTFISLTLVLVNFTQYWWTSSILATLLVLPLGFPRIYGWALPKFELTALDGESSGSRRIVIVIIVLAQIPLGIIVNLITS